MPCIPQKSKWEAARTIHLAQKLENMKTIKAGYRMQNEGNMGEIRGNIKG